MKQSLLKKQNSYRLEGREIDSIDLKCLLVSRGLKVESAVYRRFGHEYRLSANPLECNCLLLPDGTIVQLTDMAFHLKYLSGILSWEKLKLLRYASQLKTPFSLRLLEDKAALFHEQNFLAFVSFPPKTAFYGRRTERGLSCRGCAVLQGLDWVSFQCLWPCEYAASGKPCEFCFSGAEHEALAAKHRPLPPAVAAEDVREIVSLAVREAGVSALQLTGGSTFDGEAEYGNIRSYLETLCEGELRKQLTETLLYITPPSDFGRIDEYFALGATRIACSLEIWDEAGAKRVTPGKIDFRSRQLEVLTRIAEKYGAGKAFTNFIIGIEPLETLFAGGEEMARRGVLPAAAIWMPMGRAVLGSMSPPGVDYYRRVKERFAELYDKYALTPPRTRGLNVCIEADIALLNERSPVCS